MEWVSYISGGKFDNVKGYRLILGTILPEVVDATGEHAKVGATVVKTQYRQCGDFIFEEAFLPILLEFLINLQMQTNPDALKKVLDDLIKKMAEAPVSVESKQPLKLVEEFIPKDEV